METIKKKLTIEEKKKLLRDMFMLLTGVKPDTAVSKCVMLDHYKIHPLLSKESVRHIALREHDGSLCLFDSMPYGSDSDDHVHAFDKNPSLEIIPLPEKAGFRTKIKDRIGSSQNVLVEISVLTDIIEILNEFKSKYITLIES